MTIDWNTPEAKEALAAAVDDAVAGLKAKNIDLAARLEKARAGKTIDPDDYRQLEERATKAEQELADSKKAFKTASVELDKIKKAHESESNFTKSLLVDNGLVAALTGANVTKPVNIKAAKAMLKDQVTLVIDGETRKAMIGDKDLMTAISEWAGSDEGKNFVTAPVNSGGNAGGSGKGASVDVSKMSAQQKMEAGRKQA
jgi:hypothetical protein